MGLSDDQLDDLRRHGFAVAYRMLGTVADAEDVVQDALLRLTRTDPAPDEPAAWVTTVVTRRAIDVLRSARVRRETYVGPWLPEPLLEDPAPGPAERTALADSLSQALRAAFLLREAFAYDYPRIAAILDRNEPACRQLVTRARKHLEAARPRFDADEAAHDRLLARFVAAAEEGDLDELEALLHDDAVLYSDGGGKALAAKRPILGAARVARFMAGVARRRREHGIEPDAERVRVNGRPGHLRRHEDGRPATVLTIDVVDGRIAAVLIQRNPDKLAHL